MVGGKHNLCVGLTTFNNDMLGVSIPALGRIRRKFLLIIHNDNPGTTVSRRMIHDLGYRGDLLIINTEENIGPMRARMEIIRAAAAMRNRPMWLMFADDDDVVSNLGMPDDIPADNYVIIHNTLTIKHRFSDAVLAMRTPDELIPDGENVSLVPQFASVAGRIYRTDILIGFADAISNVIDAIDSEMGRLSYLAPVDNIMCALINTYIDACHPNMTPIFMNHVNYVAIKMDSATQKYGRLARPARNSNDVYAKIINRAKTILADFLGAAAPAGHNN